MSKLNFYTEKVKGGYVGLCRENPLLRYGPKKSRDTALSGVKRLAKKVESMIDMSGLTTKTKVNRIAFVIDRSGSMSSLTAAAVKALNDNINTIREQARKTGQRTHVSVFSFDTEIDLVRKSTNVEIFEPVRASEVQARGSTALLDAVGNAISVLRGVADAPNEDVSYLVMAITDGEENASKVFNSSSLNKLMREVQATDRWTLTFLVPPGYKSRLVQQYAIPEGNVAEWEGSVRGVQTYTVQNTAGIGTYFSSRAAGVNSVKSFYTDLSGLTSKQVKSQLDDISSKVRVLAVDKEQDIKSFVEDTLGRYVPGTAYYQLTKDEKKIQDYKELLVMEKGKRSVFGGPDARQVLGIPDGTLRVKPGNHGNFDIFVQSNSLNRKLVRGTKLLVKTY